MAYPHCYIDSRVSDEIGATDLQGDTLKIASLQSLADRDCCSFS